MQRLLNSKNDAHFDGFQIPQPSREFKHASKNTGVTQTKRISLLPNLKETYLHHSHFLLTFPI